ncbi:hypothetical protein CENSYa_1879 [Cenarchaeum symbiosum A]|uniref:Hemerythrin-like domain-containing protein n=1 Tax=Cenarchaeum symbiosum (strain A) TaxID=414004 RepID=A0RYS1_CENSY|nr:hypothetical protein CENSYa_1879 [Cenarchaeum symbiosum A]
MSATEILREDHLHVKRLEHIIIKCYEALYREEDVPFSDIEKITMIITEFLDAIHHAREENSYFPCVGPSGDFEADVRKFLIEHEFGRKIAVQITHHLGKWKSGEEDREPVARFLRTYAIYLMDHLSKEDKFFDEAEKALDPAEEKEMSDYFLAAKAAAQRVDELVKEIDDLETRNWYRAEH